MLLLYILKSNSIRLLSEMLEDSYRDNFKKIGGKKELVKVKILQNYLLTKLLR